MAASLDRIKRIIRELQNRTEDQGCTEAEAMEAARKMGQLLEEHDLSMSDVGLKEEASAAKENELYAPDDYAGSLITGIAKFCSLIAYHKTSRKGTVYSIFGLPHDLEIALYLYEICSEAMEHDFVAYQQTHGYSMKKRASFRAGFSGRVYTRLMEMKRERDARMASMSSRTDLVIVKDQLVRQEFDKLGIKLGKARSQTVADMGAFRQGQAAGSRVNLNNPLGGPSATTVLR